MFLAKVKEYKELDKYLDFTMELKKELCNMKVIVIAIMEKNLGTVTKNLEKSLDKPEVTGGGPFKLQFSKIGPNT